MDEFNIDKFNSSDNLYLIPTYIKEEMREKVLAGWKSLNLKSHVFIFSSGTTQSKNTKTYALSKAALISNAKAVNDFLKITPKDKWLLALPSCHVGGLSILIRSSLIDGLEVLNMVEHWDAKVYGDYLNKYQISYSSLVPTQLYDLIQQKIKPENLKGVFIGGDFLGPGLKKMAVDLGWPIIETYGMTECCSQVATAYSKNIENGFLEVLDIHKISNIENKFFIESRSLATAEILFKDAAIEVKYLNPKHFQLPDNLEIIEKNNKQYLKPLGRKNDELKIKGRLFNILELRGMFETVLLKYDLWGKAEIIFVDDEREGKKINILLESDYLGYSDQLVEALNQVIPMKLKLDCLRSVPSLSRTTLGKLKRN